MVTRRAILGSAAAAAAAGILASPSRLMAADAPKVGISRQLGILYIPTHVMETQKLIEKHAEKLGLPGLMVNWMSFANSSAQQDALLSGGVDIINSGAGPLLLLWDKTRGRVKGISACSAQPINLITHDPRIQKLEDFKDGDKIAVPTIKISTQSILLQMQARKLFGDADWGHFDPLTVQLGHADAYVAMRNAAHEVKSHFAAPPYDFYELKNVEGARKLISSADIIGGPLTQGQFMTTTDFAEKNEVILKALRAAGEEAKAFIEGDIKGAVDIYKQVSGDKTDAAQLVEMFGQPEMMQWDIFPQGTMKFAEHLNFTGAIKTMPGAWTDYYLPVVQDLGGS